MYSFSIKIFFFTAGLVTIISTLVILAVLCKHNKLKTLVTSLAMHHIKPVMSESTEEINCICKTTWISIFLMATLISIILVYLFIKARTFNVFYGDQYANSFSLYIFFSNAQYYVPVKICRLNGNMLMVKLD